MNENVYNNFIIERAIQRLENELSPEEKAHLSEEIDMHDARMQSDGFNLFPLKADLVADLVRIESLDLIRVQEKAYLSYVFSRLLQIAEIYVGPTLASNYEWPVCHECGALDVLSDSDYVAYAQKYYSICKDSLWVDDFNLFIDALTAASFLIMH